MKILKIGDKVNLIPEITCYGPGPFTVDRVITTPFTEQTGRYSVELVEVSCFGPNDWFIPIELENNDAE